MPKENKAEEIAERVVYVSDMLVHAACLLPAAWASRGREGTREETRLATMRHRSRASRMACRRACFCLLQFLPITGVALNARGWGGEARLEGVQHASVGAAHFPKADLALSLSILFFPNLHPKPTQKPAFAAAPKSQGGAAAARLPRRAGPAVRGAGPAAAQLQGKAVSPPPPFF